MLTSTIVSLAAMALGVNAAAIDTAAAAAPTKPADSNAVTPAHIVPLDPNDPAVAAFRKSQKEAEPAAKEVPTVQEQDLYEYLATNIGATHTVRVVGNGTSADKRDNEQVFIDLSTVFVANETAAEGLDKRQYTSPPYGYYAWKVSDTDKWWDNWNPASGCFYTGNSPSGGDITMGWSFSKSFSTTLSLSSATIVDLLSGSIGFTVTTQWSKSGEIKCNVPGRSVGQIWVQNRIGWGYYERASCFSYSNGGSSCGAYSGQGVAICPAASNNWGVGVNYGCSVGYDKVQC